MNLIKYTLLAILIAGSGELYAQSAQWVWNGGSTGEDVAQTCKVGPNGNVYVAGEFSGTMDLDPSTSTYNVFSNGPSDMFLACYSPAGAFIWGFNIGGSNRERIYDIAIDAQGNVFTTGFFRGTTDFDPSLAVANLTDNTTQGYSQNWMGEMFIAKYSGSGIYQWAVAMGGWSAYDMFNSLDVDGDGNVYAGGVFIDLMDIDPSSNVVNLNSVTGKLALVKFSANGQLIWGKNFGSPGGAGVNTDIRGLQVRDGNIYCAGFFTQTADFDPSGNVASFTAVGTYDGYVAKYDTAGNYVWAVPISGNDYDDALDIRVDASNNNVYITGFTHSTSVTFSPYVSSNVPSPIPGSSSKIMMAKYSSAGVYQWGRVLGGTGLDRGWDLELSGNRLYLAGHFEGTVDFDPSTSVNNLVANGGTDIFLCQYDLNGNYLCGFNVGGTTSITEGGYKVTSSSGGDIYLCGAFAGANVDFDPSTANLIRSSSGNVDAFLVKYVAVGSSDVYVLGDTVCEGEQAFITVTDTVNGGTITVTVNDGNNTYTFNAQSGVPLPLNPNPSATTTYTWSVGNQSICNSSGTSGSFTIVVNPKPVANAGPDIVVCSNTPVQLNGSGGSGYTWTPGGVLSNPNVSNPTVTVADTSITFTMVTTNSFGCSDTDQVNVSIHQGVASANAGPDTSACPGAAVQLLGSGNGSYLWYPSTGLSNTNIANPVFTGSSNSTIYLVVTDQYNCKDTDEVVITMLPQPVADAGPDQTVCPGSSVSLSASGGISYSWYPTTGMSGSNTPNPTVVANTSIVYYVVVSSGIGCTDTDAVNINVIPAPAFNIVSDRNLCPDDSVLLHAGGGDSYYWFPEVNMTENGHDSIWVSPGSTTTYYVVISSNICNAEDTLSVTVNMQSNPDVKIVQAGPKICNAPFVQLLATGASTYSWSPANTLSSEEGASPQSFAQTDTWYTVTGFNEFGCSGKDSALMRVETDNFNGLFVPSVFTPNADGKNDCYRIILPPGLSEYELHIYNRWGENVFSADDPTDCWDGTYKGEPCDLGTYFYYYKLKSDRCEIEKEGKGTLLC